MAHHNKDSRKHNGQKQHGRVTLIVLNIFVTFQIQFFFAWSQVFGPSEKELTLKSNKNIHST